MPMVYKNLIPTLWLAWIVYWWISARHVKANVRQETNESRAAYVLPLMLAAFLLSLPEMPGVLGEYIFSPSRIVFWIGAAILTLGICFSIWARIHLGRNWSGTVTIKHDHELIQSGPYQLVRHPIYTGLLMGLAGTALACDKWYAALALLIAFAALWRKLKLEELWLKEKFEDEYTRYCAKVAALIPFLF